MKKIIIYPLILVLLISSVYAATMTMDVPSGANPGEQFAVRFETTDATGNYGFLTSLDVTSGGCIPDHQSGMVISPSTSGDFTVTSPQSAGSCTLSGKYKFVDTEDHGWITISSQTITISGDCIPSTCSDMGYECNTWDDGCGTTLSCGSCTSGETCTNGDCVAEGCSCTNWVNVGCVGTVMKQTRSCTPNECEDEERFTASTTCEAAPGDEVCGFGQTEKDDGTCGIAIWVYLAIAGFIAFMIFK